MTITTWVDLGQPGSIRVNTRNPQVRFSNDLSLDQINSFRTLSTIRYVFFLLGRVISWSSKCQPTVTLSMTEAKYMGLTHVTREAM